MAELLRLALKLDLSGLMVRPTSNVAIQAFRALFVGTIVFAVDAGILWLVHLTGIHYLTCAVISFVAAVMINYTLSAKFVFIQRASVGMPWEITVYFFVSLAGLGLTVGLMWFFTEIMGLFFMVSKAIAALLAFAWNFTARKIILYRAAQPRDLP